MYKSLIGIFAFLLIASSTDAQVMPAKSKWITIKSANLKCWPCKEKLEKYLTKENYTNMNNGIIQWKISLLNGEIRVLYSADRVSPDEIKTAINNAGFDADEEKAEPDAYKALPPVCKRGEDGGGPQKGKPCHMPPYQR